MSKKPKTVTTVQFDDAISTYYKLKGQYNTNINKLVKEIYDKKLSPEEKKTKFAEVKRKCVVCGKLGGTIFEEDNTMLLAKCGNQDNPCKLDIKLERAKYDNILKVINTQNGDINRYKNDIITTKLNFLFGFKNQETTLSEFEKLKGDLVKIIKQYQNNTSKYIKTIYNAENTSGINTLDDKLYANIKIFKDNIDSYKETGQQSFLKDALEIYVNTIIIINKELRALKYKIQEVIHNKDNDTYKLVQNSYTLSDLQIIQPDTENKVIIFSV